MEPRQLVADAYDVIAEEYLRRFGRSPAKDRWVRELATRIPPGARILDLGCGAGLPVARWLVDQGFHIAGVDASARQIELARRNVPEAAFVQADMTDLALEPAAFGAVAAFYALNHVPRARYASLLRAVFAWLQPGGVFVGNFAAADEAGWTGEWLGAETFFSGFDACTVLRLVGDAGFEIEHHAVDGDPEDDGEFVWLIARKPTP